jgi:hypothetical protein
MHQNEKESGERHTSILPQFGMAEVLVHRLLAIFCDIDVHFVFMQPGI